MGQLCSEYKTGYSIVFGSTQCYICTNIWLLTIILYAFLGSLSWFTKIHNRSWYCYVHNTIIMATLLYTFGVMDLVGVNPQYIKYESIFLALINLLSYLFL